MKVFEFQKQVLLYFIGKFHELRGDGAAGRVISVSPGHFVRDYMKNTADLERKQAFTATCDQLEKQGFIRTKRLKYSVDIERLYLNEKAVPAICEWLEEYTDYISPEKTKKAIAGWFADKEKDDLLCFYEEKVRNTGGRADLDSVREMVGLLDFLKKNERTLYLREASVLCFGDSKKLEEKYLNELVSLVREVYYGGSDADVSTEECLKQIRLMRNDGEIVLKGAWILTWEDTEWNIASMQGAVSISEKDIERLKSVRIDTKEMMSVENKTSFMRMSGEKRALFYLGGYASSTQIAFLKKLKEIPAHTFYHFGDIDIGGFMIHRHLVRESGIPFQLWHMGKNELTDSNYIPALRALSENDRRRAAVLEKDPYYSETIAYMLQNNVKLEQEIISYCLTSG